jgi:nucleoside 2-deoxyribosyltransferase
MKIYLAGPITGRGYDEVVELYKDKARTLSEFGFEVLCPMTGKTHLRNEIEFKAKGFGHPVSSNHAIFERDKWMVSNCDVILADLRNSGNRVSIGTMMECAWGAAFGKHVVVVMQDDNIHQHAFVLEAANIVFSDYNEAISYLRELAYGILGADNERQLQSQRLGRTHRLS